MLTRKDIVVYIFLCLFLAFLQTASNAFQHYGKTLVASSLLFYAFGFIVQYKYPKILIWQIFAALIPYFLIIGFTEFYQEDIPVIVGAITSLGLAIVVYRSNRNATFKGTVTFLWLSGLVYFAFWQIPQREITNRYLEMNEQLPVFTLLNANAEKISTAEWKGKVVLIDMWYTKCGACVKQLRASQKIEQHFRANPDVLFSAVDCGYDSLKAIEAFKSRFPFLNQYYLDQNSLISKHLGIEDFPRTLVIDKQGKLRLHVEGFSKEWEEEYQEKVTSTIEQLVRE